MNTKHIYGAALLIGFLFFIVATAQAATQWAACGQDNVGYAIVQGMIFGEPNNVLCESQHVEYRWERQ